MARLVALIALAAVVAGVSLIALPGVAQVTDADIARAEADLATLREELAELNQAWENAVAKKVTIETSVEQQSQRLLETTLLVSELELEAEDRAAEMYMDAAVTGFSSFLAPGSLDGAGAGLGYLDEVADSDRQLLTELEAQNDSLERQQAELSEATGLLDDAADELDSSVNTIIVKLEEAQEKYDYLVRRQAEEEAARRAAEEAARRAAEEAARKAAEEAAAAAAATSTTVAGSSGGSTDTTTGGTTETTTPPTTTVPPAPATGGKTCPINGATSFSDSWGAPRSGGRYHKGTDMLAARGAHVVAIETGTISRLSTSSLGGISIYFRGDSGAYYYYAHLDGYAAGISSGQRVTVGTLLGYNGSTGNAPAHVPHVHFQYAANGSTWINPYPMLAELCF
jgi:murein DD-endopeptidase MepM/ murein hydrolase activator NlpD